MNSTARPRSLRGEVTSRDGPGTSTPDGPAGTERRRLEWLAAASTVAHAVTEEAGDRRGRLDAVAETLRVLQGADAAVLFVDHGAGLEEFCSAGGPDLPAGMLLATRAPAPSPSCVGAGVGVGPCDVPAHVLGWVAERVVLVGVRPADTAEVVLALGWVGPPGAGGELDARVVHRFLTEVSEAVALAGRIEGRIRRAVSRDRDRIARDLHDHVIQRLFAVGMSLQGATVSADAADAVESAVDSLDETIRDVRRAIFALQERHPDPDGRADLDTLVRTVGASLGFLPVLTVQGPLSSLPAAVRREAMAVVREALSNVVRHARATRVTVDVTVVDRADVVVTVTDDGRVGVAAHRPGLGIGNVVERARGLGGSATVLPLSSGGTQVRWSVPLPPS